MSRLDYWLHREWRFDSNYPRHAGKTYFVFRSSVKPPLPLRFYLFFVSAQHLWWSHICASRLHDTYRISGRPHCQAWCSIIIRPRYNWFAKSIDHGDRLSCWPRSLVGDGIATHLSIGNRRTVVSNLVHWKGNRRKFLSCGTLHKKSLVHSLSSHFVYKKILNSRLWGGG